MGYYFLFELNKHLARAEMQSVISQHREKITVIRIADVESNKDFQRIHQKEFRYKGEMYDVVREIKSGITTVFICVHDVKEARLFAGLKRVNQNKVHIAAWPHVVMIFISYPTVEISPGITATLIYPRIDAALISTELPTWSPPPEFS
jgi:hypothetical protein